MHLRLRIAISEIQEKGSRGVGWKKFIETKYSKGRLVWILSCGEPLNEFGPGRVHLIRVSPICRNRQTFDDFDREGNAVLN